MQIGSVSGGLGRGRAGWRGGGKHLTGCGQEVATCTPLTPIGSAKTKDLPRAGARPW